jgi:hypothetical protein
VFELQYGLEGRLPGERWCAKDLNHEVYNTSIHSESPCSSKDADSDDIGAGHWPVYSDGAPMRDAFDICIDHALSWHSGRIPDFRNVTVPECWNGWLDKTANSGKGKCRSDPKPVDIK